MQDTYTNKHPKDFDDEIDLFELFYVLIRGKWVIVFLTAFISICGVIYSLLLPNVYESKSILVPVSSSNSSAKALGGYSSFAGLAGMNLSSFSNADNSSKAIQKISSLSFFENNILPNIFLPNLMAVKSWDAKTNTLTFDDSIFDIKNNTWVRDYHQQKIPTPQESFKVFKTEHLNISEDTKNGFINLTIKHQSPLIAKQWADLIVNEVNAFYRQKDKLESEKAINYLNQQILMTSLTEIKEVLAQLLKEEIKKLTLVEANESYVFEYIDPPAVMEKKSEPQRALIFILSMLLGVMVSMVVVLIRHYQAKHMVV